MHHGFHLAEDVLQKIKETGSSAKAFRVKVGESLSVSEEELLDAFGLISSPTPFAEVKLVLEMVPVRAVCASCQAEFAPKTFRLDCPNCGSTNIKIVSGQGIEVEPLSAV